MARDKNDFSTQLPDIGAPTAPDGRLLEAAGAAAGKAAAIAGQTKAGVVSFLGTVATEAVQGGMKASEESEINDVLRKLDTTADHDIDANSKRLAGQLLESTQSEDYAGAQTVAHFTEEARRYAEARRQGVIGREEVVAQIGAIVKKYSAMAPGWAGEFRKVGAELTGISNIDVYGIHKALTTESTREKLAQKAAEQDMQLRKEAASALGLTSIDQLTPDAVAFYRHVKQSQLAVSSMEAQKKAGDMRQEVRDQVNQRLANAHIASVVGGVATEFAQLGAAHLAADTPEKQAAALKLGGEVAAKLDVAEAQLIAQIKGLSIGQNAMDSDKNKKLVEEVQSIFKTYKEVVKTQEGFNLWNQIVKNAKGNAEYVVNAFKAAHPHAAVLAEFGVMSKFVEAMVALGGDRRAFEARFGKKAAAETEAVLNYGAVYPNTLGGLSGGRTNLDAVASVDTTMARVAYNDIVQIIEDQAKNGGVLRNEQRQSLSNLVHQWLGKMNHTDPANLKKFQQIAGNPEGKFWTQMVQLDPEQRKHALLPLFDRVVNTTPNILKDMKEQVTAYNNLEENKTAGHQVEIKYDALTNSFKLDVQRGTGVSPRSSLPKGAYGADLSRNQLLLSEGFDRLATRGEPSQRETLGVLEQRVSWLNTVADVMARALPLANDEFSGIKPAELGAAMWKSYQGDGSEGVGEALKERMNKHLVPKNSALPDPTASMRRESDVRGHVAATNTGDAPPTANEAKAIHESNIRALERDIKAVTFASGRKLLEEELTREKAALAALR